MTDQYQNHGPVVRAQIMRDVTINNYHAHELIINQYATVKPREFSLRNIPEPHGAFIGRVEYVKSAIEYLSHPVTTDTQIQFPCLVIHALGGYGKTQTARKIASVCKKTRTFQHFIWIDSEDDLSIKKCFVAVMKDIGIYSADKGDAANFDSLMHQLYNVLANRKKEKFVIIFDNVEDFDNILKYLPLNRRVSNLAVLMTSQRPFLRESYGHVRNQRLDLMPEEEAIQLAENILGKSTMDSEEDKKLLVQQSGRITLVLCVMASTIKFQRRYTSDYSLKDYLKEMKDQPIQYSDESNALDLTYEKSLQKIVRFAVNKLNAIGGPMGRIGVKFFDRLAYCSPTNRLTKFFFHYFFWDICEEAENMDMKLPLQPVNDLQIIRMAMEKLSEFSLVQIDGHEFTVHRWIQASRRLDLKDSSHEEIVLRELLFILPEDSFIYQDTSTIWQHVANYSDLFKEFYRRKGTLMRFPIYYVDSLEKIIGKLTQAADFEPFESYSDEIVQIICENIIHRTLDEIQRIVKAFNYDASKNSKKFLFSAISGIRLDVVKWLVNEMSCIPEDGHFHDCFNSNAVLEMIYFFKDVKEFILIYDEAKREPRFRWTSPSQYFENLNITYLMSTLVDPDPLRIALCRIIKRHCGKNFLEGILSTEPIIVESYIRERSSHRIKIFEIIRFLLSTLNNSESNIHLDEIREKYSESSLLECLIICGRQHYSSKPSLMPDNDWNDVHRAAYENNFTAIKSIDPTLIESKDRWCRTPLIIAVKAGACETTTVLLEKYSANVNTCDDFGNTPLSRSIEYSHPSILKILLSHGAKTHWTINYGRVNHALHYALECFDRHDIPDIEEIIGTVLNSKDCDVCATDRGGNNILHQLVRNYYGTKYKPNHRVLQLILSTNGTLVNIRNNDGLTPLQLAKNLQAKFSDDHWHISSLQSVILELEKLCEKNSPDALKMMVTKTECME